MLLGDKCQSNRKENINFSIVKVRCVPRVIVIGIFIAAIVTKGILSWGSFFQVSRERENYSSTCLAQKKSGLAQSDLLIGIIILSEIKVWV